MNSLNLDGLTNYWPFNSDLRDYVGDGVLAIGQNVNFTSNRLGTPTSAVFLNKGYLNITSGVRFSGNFTITAWVYLIRILKYARLIDCGINIVFADWLGNPAFFYSSYAMSSSTRFTVNAWYHMAVTLQANQSSFYINGQQTATMSMPSPPPGPNPSNFCWFGKSGSNDPNTVAYYDEIKIYNRSLTPTEIVNDANLNL